MQQRAGEIILGGVTEQPTASVDGPTGCSLSPAAESAVFWRLRRRLFVNVARLALRQARLRVALVLLLSGVFWGALFWLFADGFGFLIASIGRGETLEQVVSKVFAIFFASLLTMLMFSSGIILYGSLFRSRETQLLLTMPARAERIFIHKFQEAMFFSSWGCLLLGTPMLVAYGLRTAAPWYYYLSILPFLVAFVHVPGSLGGIACLLVVRYLPANRKRLLILLGAVAGLIGLWIGWSTLGGPRGELLTPEWFQQTLSRLRFSEHRLLPSWWASAGLLELSAGRWSEGVLFLALCISNALFFFQVAVWTARAQYRAGYSALHDKQLARKAAGIFWLDRLLARRVLFLSPPMRLLMVKDLRLFRRDPLQWSQFLIFFGLLGMYFLNIRRLSYDVTSAGWVNMISFLNMAVVGLLLSTFTTRFIFPMISLEGRRFWILGLLPIRREDVLWSKFLFASIGSLIACSLLITLSDVMLQVAPVVLGVHLLTCALLCCGLSGIAVGLGAIMPDLKEESPSKIAAGFGGTLNLVISTIYIVAVILLTAVPCHFYLAGNSIEALGGLLDRSNVRWWLAGGVMCSLLLGILATVIPLRMGFRAFRRLEF